MEALAGFANGLPDELGLFKRAFRAGAMEQGKTQLQPGLWQARAV